MSSHTVVISRNPGGDEGKTATEKVLAAVIAGMGHNVLVLPHLYYLSPKDNPIKKLVALEEPLVVASWLHPRPAEWILRYLGCAGEIKAVNIAEFCCPDMCAEAMLSFAGKPPEENGKVEETDGPVTERWYPVLDYSKCVSCGQCFEFCLFGVFRLEADGKVLVEVPENCKPGCPACARVCPAGAIMFPHYRADGGIAGAPGEKAPRAKINAVSLKKTINNSVAAGCDCAGTVQACMTAGENDTCACCSSETDPADVSAETVAPDTGGDDIDDLIEALDNLDV